MSAEAGDTLPRTSWDCEDYMDNDDREQAVPQENDEVVIPVIEEEVVADARPVKTGAVRVDKHVETRIRRIDTPLLHEEVEGRHVPVNRVVTQNTSGSAKSKKNW
jgi:stress response protein YsnF